ncbi:hypothetical protein PLESTB_000642100 [Pleodorina starrii]|uniref:Starch synthase, chloroplastic/amyloplastic n=1 Tax=Pleodorina starrii TaxID=330485 RepID=A0A9W6BJG6_9CHLO|nr:hypothetical protein PLESTM_001303400 [Pleodorina starrii]GLC52551.1 hypothetical protein PLESTB_000642100 [Pleodorina starrii]GLC71551.1 hypothetical protein PLESTF_001134300 [Pleodorina starrii]
MLLSGRTINAAKRRFREAPANVTKPCRAMRAGRSLAKVQASVAAAPAVYADVPGIETTHDANVHGSSGAVQVEVPGLKRATELRNMIFVTSEVAPWSKTGGLADVLGSLPFALAERGHRVMVVAPRYAPYDGPVSTGVKVTLMGHAEVMYFHQQIRGVDFVFVDHPSYPRPGGLYADEHGVYGDNQFRFTLLCLAATEAPFFLDLPIPPQQMDPPRPTSTSTTSTSTSADGNGSNGAAASPAAAQQHHQQQQQQQQEQEESIPRSKYGEDVVFVANDWHASLVPVYLAAKYRPHGVYRNARCIMAIHNLRHQGVFSPGSFASLDLPGHWYGCLEWQYPPHQRQGSWAEEGRSVNHLKAGLTTSDRIVTVSAGYAEEIQTYLGGWGMEGIIASRSPVLNGVVNGIDTDEWNPAIDPHLPYKYDTTNFVEGKAQCKMELQRELGLPVSEHIPLIAFIGRLDPQKGADILLEAAPQLLRHNNVQLVCLGSGNKDLEDGLRWLEGEFRDRARGWVGFNVPLSHRLTAAADILLMPSRFEPCGLNQLYAMRYGAVPVAHKTGGLRDTVTDFNPWGQSGTGWTYTSCDAQGLLQATGLALLTYHNHREDFRKLQLRGMTREASWDQAAQQYEQIISWALMDPPYCR